MNREKYSNYQKYMDLFFAEKPSEFALFEEDESLTYDEKKLLRARVLIRNKLWEEAIELLETIKTEIDFLKAEKYAVMGSSYLYLSNYEESAKFSVLATRAYAIVGDKTGLFITNYNLSVAYNRLGMDSLSHYYLTQAQQNIVTQNHSILLRRALACHHSRMCETDKAVKLVDELFSELDQMNDYDKDIFLTVAADIYSRALMYEKALKVTTLAKNSYVNREKGRVYFYHALLNHVIHGEKLPKKPQSVQEIKEFDLQWDILSALLAGDREEAHGLWNKLIRMFPKFFGQDFIAIDKSESRTLFMSLVKKLTDTKAPQELDLDMLKGKKAKQLIEILMKTKGSIRKELLIEEIWGVPYSPEYDSRFYKLIERVRSGSNVKIINENNSYKIA